MRFIIMEKGRRMNLRFDSIIYNIRKLFTKHLSKDNVSWDEQPTHEQIFNDIYSTIARESGMTIKEVKQRAVYDSNGVLDICQTILACSKFNFAKA